MDALEQVGLSQRMAMLPDGLDTSLAASGWPLSIAEVMALKLANALLSRPKVLVLSQLFDMMAIDRLKSALDDLRTAGTTILLNTGRPEALELDGYLWLGRTEQKRFETRQGMIDHVDGKVLPHA